uniref:Tc1-like transposase DDE domain-containing protein n=1 Tax=Scophthalmus maximus TaxID=52904 RepID=A0A8D3ALG7_SCOMX
MGRYSSWRKNDIGGAGWKCWRTIASHTQEGSMQKDNARPHRAAAVREFLDAEGVHQMPWPACSHDMNPIEHAWDALGQALNERDQKSEST